MNRRGHSFEVCGSAHVALRMLLAFFQPVSCIFRPIKTLNWLVAACKLHKHRRTGCTAELPNCPSAILGLKLKWMCVLGLHVGQTSFFSCAEANSIKFDTRATLDLSKIMFEDTVWNLDDMPNTLPWFV